MRHKTTTAHTTFIRRVENSDGFPHRIHAKDHAGRQATRTHLHDALQHGVEPPRANVLHRFVDEGRHARDFSDGLVLEAQRHVLRREEGHLFFCVLFWGFGCGCQSVSQSVGRRQQPRGRVLRSYAYLLRDEVGDGLRENAVHVLLRQTLQLHADREPACFDWLAWQ